MLLGRTFLESSKRISHKRSSKVKMLAGNMAPKASITLNSSRNGSKWMLCLLKEDENEILKTSFIDCAVDVSHSDLSFALIMKCWKASPREIRTRQVTSSGNQQVDKHIP